MTILNKIIKAPERALSKIIPHQHAADRRAANELAAQQIEVYKTSKAQLEAEEGRLKVEKENERVKANSKLIHNLQYGLRAPSIMGDMTSTGKPSNNLSGMGA